MKRLLTILIITICLPATMWAGTCQNVILFIGDGMGAEHIRAGSLFATGRAGQFSFESFPHRALISTHSADNAITDSAAAATAMATGVKVGNRVLGLRLPGDGARLETAVERFQQAGMAVGLVTTTYIEHATIAAFAAHQPFRENYEEILTELVSKSRPELIFGGLKTRPADSFDYKIITDAAGLGALDTEAPGNVWGRFGTGNMPYERDDLAELPHLSEMTQTALRILDDDPEGFFLLVEGGRIDHASHGNDAERMVAEVAEFARAVDRALAWASGREDTLILVTADHETGGLKVLSGKGRGQVPSASWSTDKHTGVRVPLYATGEGAEGVTGEMDNTDIFGLLVQALSKAGCGGR